VLLAVALAATPAAAWPVGSPPTITITTPAASANA